MQSLPLLAIFGVGPWELAFVALILLVLFGHRLPAAMRGLGRSAKEFREGLKDAAQPQQEAIS